MKSISSLECLCIGIFLLLYIFITKGIQYLILLYYRHKLKMLNKEKEDKLTRYLILEQLRSDKNDLE